MSEEDEMPRDFGLRYVGWFLWSNALTIMFILQLSLQQLAYDRANAEAPWVHWALTGSNILGIIGAQIKRNRPPGPPPTKAPPS